MAEILSQEEIDRLLNVSTEKQGPSPTELSPDEVKAVEKLTRIFFASANSALTTLLARPVSVSEGVGQVMAVADLDTAKTLLLRFPFRSGFSGQMAFLMRHREASMLADLILGGEGTAKETLDDADFDALKEAMAQVAGSGAPTLSATLGQEVAFGPPEVEETQQGELSFALPWGQAFLGVGTVKVDGVLEAPLRILLPVEVAQKMGARLGTEEPVTHPSAAPAAPVRPSHATAAPYRAPALAAPEVRNIDLILDIQVEVMVRLGETVMPLKEIQRLRPGSIIDLDKDTEAPVELVVNDQVIATGELVVVSSDHFALRITEIETPTERIRRLGS